MPPSPKQQSCFNSPQGSPGPHSISSQQDINSFPCNNYETMQKKFDLFNLEASHLPFNSYNSKNIINGSNNSGILQNTNCNNINTTDASNNDTNQSKNNLLTHSSKIIENLNFSKQQHINTNNQQTMQHSNNNRYSILIPLLDQINLYIFF